MKPSLPVQIDFWPLSGKLDGKMVGTSWRRAHGQSSQRCRIQEQA